MGGGSENHITKNLFVGSTPPVALDSRGTTWQKFVFEGGGGTIRKRLAEVPYRGKLYQSRYPGIERTLEAEGVPFGNVIEGNLAVGSGVPKFYAGADKTNRIGKIGSIPARDFWTGARNMCEVLWDGGAVPVEAMLKHMPQ
jgi:hypothetical protein